MRHIKLFETYVYADLIQVYPDQYRLSPWEIGYINNLKFKFNDIVKTESIIGGKITYVYYKIIGIDTSDIDIPYKVENLEHSESSFWVREDEIEKVEEYELDANKYNI